MEPKRAEPKRVKPKQAHPARVKPAALINAETRVNVTLAQTLQRLDDEAVAWAKREIERLDARERVSFARQAIRFAEHAVREAAQAPAELLDYLLGATEILKLTITTTMLDKLQDFILDRLAILIAELLVYLEVSLEDAIDALESKLMDENAQKAFVDTLNDSVDFPTIGEEMEAAGFNLGYDIGQNLAAGLIPRLRVLVDKIDPSDNTPDDNTPNAGEVAPA